MKRVCKADTVTLGGVDISDICQRVAIIGQVGELWRAEVDIIDTPSRRPLAVTDITDRESGAAVAVKPHELDPEKQQATVTVGGADVSDWVHRIELTGEDKGRNGFYRWYRLHLWADEDVLSINGTAPWVPSN